MFQHTSGPYPKKGTSMQLNIALSYPNGLLPNTPKLRATTPNVQCGTLRRVQRYRAVGGHCGVSKKSGAPL